MRRKVPPSWKRPRLTFWGSGGKHNELGVFIAVWGVAVGAAEARPVSVPQFPHHYHSNNAVHLPGLEGVGLSQLEDPEPAGCIRVGTAPYCWGGGRGRGRRTPESGVTKDSSGKWTEALRPGSEPWAARPGFLSCWGLPGSSRCPSHKPVGLTVGILGQQGGWIVGGARLQPPYPPSFGRPCARRRLGRPCGSVGGPGLGLGEQGLRCGQRGASLGGQGCRVGVLRAGPRVPMGWGPPHTISRLCRWSLI